ncbi:leucine--tRNA ligase [Candidatus Woesearchaeota archaeon]|nr:leucine--tRNA ligase [Candidatus Woesearchaeota archaeon]
MDFKAIEQKWQAKWEDKKVFEVKEDDNKDKFYVLEMFPYPSGSGLHMGHALNYTIGDIFARYKIMNSFNVLHPMGYDALGLPAENAAIKEDTHPEDYTNKSIQHYIKQQKALGLTYDWTRMVNTADPSFYKWDQWIFLKLFEKGLAYQKESAVNWCPKCDTVLANEQVHDGKCWRHEDTSVQVKQLRQWFFKTTAYAEELYDSIDALDWPERTKAMQKNWIGKSYGTEILFDINKEQWPIFTTRPDTLFGVTFMVVSAQHKKLQSLVTPEQQEEVNKFLKQVKSVSEKDLETMEKIGVFTGSYATNPATGEKVPVYAGNFVVADYGAGMVMAVPAHDQRDFEFAKKYNIPIKQVIQGEITETRAFTEYGKLMNSNQFNNLGTAEAKEKITAWLAEKNAGKQFLNFKLRDWGVSRQRYWGTPIPIIHCEKCGAVPVPESDLPITLPKDVTFGQGNPLATSKSFVNTTCPKCSAPAKRETDTMDTFVNSSWYFLRYTDPNNNNEIFDKDKVNYWTPVDMYIGGAEHACMHLIYFRFYTKFLRDLGLLNFDEPAKVLFHQGMLHGEDGNKMSKSRGNVVLPATVSEKYGIDTARLFLVSVAGPDKDIDWSTTGIEGSLRLVKKIDEFIANVKFGKSSPRVESIVNRTIVEVTEDIEKFRYNLAVIQLRTLFNSFESEIAKEDLEAFLKLLNPICPHITEEWWEKIGNKDLLSVAPWPKANENKINLSAEMIYSFDYQVMTDVEKVLKLANIEKPSKITLIISPAWKYLFFKELKKEIEKTRNGGELIKNMMSKDEFKPFGKDVTKIIPSALKDASKLPEVVLDANTEKNALEKNIEKIASKFNKCKVSILIAEESNHPKASQASPGKPAIVIE